MPVVEELKRIVEKLTGIGRPARGAVERLVRPRKPELLRFRDDGETPNNPRLPLMVYRAAVRLDRGYDPPAVFEEIFARHGWRASWRDGVYDFLHFHSATHEVLGIARGRVTVQFGGAQGRSLTLAAGDVVVLPAGTGHRRIRASPDLLVVGAYPAGAQLRRAAARGGRCRRGAGLDRQGETAASRSCLRDRWTSRQAVGPAGARPPASGCPRPSRQGAGKKRHKSGARA
jgi:uncharacterized protein YjlB